MNLQEESQLAKITRDSAKITVEQVHGLMSQVLAVLISGYLYAYVRNCSLRTNTNFIR